MKKAVKDFFVGLWAKVVATFDALYAHMHSAFSKFMAMINAELSSARGLVITIFIAVFLFDLCFKGHLGVVSFAIQSLKDIKDIILATGNVGIIAIAAVIVAYFVGKDKK